MKIEREEFERERNYLNKTVSLIRKKISKLGQELFDDDSKVLEFKKLIWDTHTEMDPNEMRSMMAESDLQVSIMQSKGNYLQRLFRIQNKPYFGSIRFKEEGSEEEDNIYIGITHVEDKLDYYVHDWRSPICSMFYDYETGPASYKAPSGIIKGNIIKKRQYIIEDAELKHIFDNDLNISDSLLQEVLAEESSDKMKNIVNTIQEEQNKVIRNTEDKNLIVEGIAGSGKTSVALHRIAFLLYRIPNLTSSNVVVFTPNKVFSEYISNVLPELGEDNTYDMTFYDLLCQNINEYKDIENTLIEARKKAEESDRLKMAFLANMSHEIRTPLNAIVGFSDVIASTYNELSDEERADFVRLISINSEHLVRLIDDILDLSKIESNTIKFTYSCCSLKSMMKDIEKEQAVKQLPEIEIKALLPDDDIYINTDATRLKQVICNFINNARKFTEKGYIHFGFTSHSEKDQLVYLFVEDTGEGIPQECQKEIFDRFYKVNTFKQGTGLGLSICKTIVEHLQGSISVESEIGKGSRFIVTLPFKRQSKGV